MTLTTEQSAEGRLARTVARRHTGTARVPDDVNELEFDLPGVRLEPTSSIPGDGTANVARVVRVTRGPGVTDFVTHEAAFVYSTFGIHVGQDDRLTFFGEDQRIAVHLIDCREDSAQLGEEITIELGVSPHRVLIIPKGVAHTLDGLAGVVTRDEPVWYADQNPDWELDNDLVSFARETELAPVVQTNRHLLPVPAHLLVSRMSQRTNSAVHNAYAGRYRVMIGGQYTYITVRPHWRAAEVEPDPNGPVQRNNFVLTGPESFTIVPNTDSCTSDVVELDLGNGDGDARFVRHSASRRRLTWLAGNPDARLELVRPDGERRVIEFADPTICVLIPPGTWYRILGAGRIWLRCELELLDVETSSLPLPRGADVETADSPTPSRAEQETDRYVPGAALNALARAEALAMSHSS